MPEPQRHDPVSRPPDGAINRVTYWANLDPKRVYCEANPNDDATGVSEMRRMGWRVEKHHKDGPVLLGGDAASDGTVLMRLGQVLMSRPKSEQDAYEESKGKSAMQVAHAIGSERQATPEGMKVVVAENRYSERRS